MKTRLAMAAIFTFGVLAFAAGCSKERAHGTGGLESETAVKTTLVKVERQRVRDTYKAVGTVRSEATVTLSAKVMGFVKEMRVSAGDRIAKGQLLAVLEAPEITANVNRAKAGTEEARRQLEGMESSMAEAEAAQAAAQAEHELAEATYGRYEKLFNDGVVSRQVFDETKAKRAVATADLDRAKKSLSAARARKRQVEAVIRQAEAGASEARAILDYLSVYSPFDGIVVERKLEDGSLASPGSPIYIIEKTGSYQFESTVDESRIDKLALGGKVTVAIDVLDYKASERVNEIKPSADTGSRSFTVKTSLGDAGIHGRLRSGMFGRATFDMGTAEKILIPSSSIAKKGPVNGVYAVDEQGTAHFRIIKTGEENDGGMVEVYSGLSAGETVAAANVDGIRDGGKVKEQ